MDTLLWNNDLEQAVIERYPGIKDIKEMLLDHGAETAMMTGSGSTVFGVFSSEKAARKAAMDIEKGNIDARAVAVRRLRLDEQ
jgi:4-diphosphocytidyl-2-C-methyl-D-erythritol kinase